MSEENEPGTTKKVFKVLGILFISFLALVVVAFGLLVGICGLRR